VGSGAAPELVVVAPVAGSSGGTEGMTAADVVVRLGAFASCVEAAQPEVMTAHT